MEGLTIARAIHVLSLIHWIGGLAFVTSVILPFSSSIADPVRRLAFLENIEQRFSRQVKLSIVLVGISGFYMAWRLEAWPRFLDLATWWMVAMALLWALFFLVLFVAEPLLLHDWFHRRASLYPDNTFRLMRRAHWILLTASLAVAAAAVLGAHGLLG